MDIFPVRRVWYQAEKGNWLWRDGKYRGGMIFEMYRNECEMLWDKIKAIKKGGGGKERKKEADFYGRKRLLLQPQLSTNKPARKACLHDWMSFASQNIGGWFVAFSLNILSILTHSSLNLIMLSPLALVSYSSFFPHFILTGLQHSFQASLFHPFFSFTYFSILQELKNPWAHKILETDSRIRKHI